MRPTLAQLILYSVGGEMSVFDEISRALSGKSPVGARKWCWKSIIVWNIPVPSPRLRNLCVCCLGYRSLSFYVFFCQTYTHWKWTQQKKKTKRKISGKRERGSTTKCIFNLSRIVKFKSSHFHSCFEIQSVRFLSMQERLVKKKHQCERLKSWTFV